MLLRDALKAGLSVAEFWALTPRETAQVLRSATWRWQHEYDRDTRLAWHMAALQRSKRLPPLRTLLSTFKTHKLKGEELAKRKAEHEELKRKMLDARRR